MSVPRMKRVCLVVLAVGVVGTSIRANTALGQYNVRPSRNRQQYQFESRGPINIRGGSQRQALLSP